MKKLSAVIIALMMALTITSQVPAFALEEDAPEQLATEQPEGLTEEEGVAQSDEQPGELTEESGLTDEADTVQPSEPPARQSEETEAESPEPESEPGVELMAAGTLITASGLTKLTTKPTAANYQYCALRHRPTRKLRPKNYPLKYATVKHATAAGLLAQPKSATKQIMSPI